MSHKITAQIFYGRSIYNVNLPAITFTEAETMDDRKLAALCLKHMSQQAGGFLESMANDVGVARHPKGAIQVIGQGWQVRFELSNWEETCKAEATKDIAAFASQFAVQQFDASDLIAYVVSLKSRS